MFTVTTALLVAQPAEDLNAIFDRALAYSEAGDDAKAIPEYRKLLTLASDIYEVHINFGQVLLRAKQTEEAVTHLRRAHEMKPAEFRPAYFLGDALFELGQFAEALPAYEAAAKIDPKDAPAELGVGRTLARLDKLTEAEPHYRQAAKLDPELRRFLLELAQARQTAGNIDAAIALYEEFPDNPSAVERVGLLRFQQGKDREAIASLESAVRTAPTANNQLALAQAYASQKDFAKAEPLAAQIADASPRNFDLRMFYARVLRDQRKFKESAREFLNAAKIDPTAAMAWSELSGMLILDEQYPEALAALDQVAKLGAEKDGHLFFRATVLDHLHHTKEALEYYQRFVAVSRTNPDQEFQARQRAKTLERELGKK